MRRLTFRRVLVALTLCIFCIAMYVVMSPRFYSGDSPLNFERHDAQIRRELHYSNFRSDTFDQFVSGHRRLAQQPMAQRCEAFFDDLLAKSPDFSIPEFTSPKYEKHIVNMQGFFHDRQTPKKSSAAQSHAEIYGEFKEKVKETLASEKEMVDAITLLRVYSQCAFGQEPNFELTSKMHRRLFPHLLPPTPQFMYFGGAQPLTISNGVPDLSAGKYDGRTTTIKKGEDLLAFYHRSINGRGIVISSSIRHARDTAKLIRVLRALNNRLPIQIVYRGAFTEKNKQLLIRVATEDKEELLKSTSQSEVIWPDIDIRNDGAKFGCEYPKQEIWFVNVKPTADNIYRGYNIKLLALLFSSFQEAVLIDADTVPLVPPEQFFETAQYNATGTLFFKDRSIRDWNKYIESNFMLNLMPTRPEPIDALFDVKPLDLEKLKTNNFLRGWRHYQEAGVVVIDKKLHFKSMPMLITLGVWGEPVKTSFWGDKEFYWLALLLSGDQNYAFNKYEAASVGELTTNPHHTVYGAGTSELCSSHPGHVNEKGELLWINSGFSYCKKNGAIRDKHKFPFTEIDSEKAKDLYGNPLRIRHALVPPSLPNFRDFTTTSVAYENTYKPMWETSTHDFDENDSVDPSQKRDLPFKPWVKSGLCTSYQYCAYDKVDSSPYGVDIGKGSVFAFTDFEVDKFSYLGKLWLTTDTSLKQDTVPVNPPAVQQQNKPTS